MEKKTLQDAFKSAVDSGQTQAWREMLQAKVTDSRSNLDLDYCLLDAVRNLAALEDVLKLKPNLSTENHEGERAIHLASKYGTPESLQMLAKAGSVVNCSSRAGWAPLHLACLHSRLDNVETLLRLGSYRNATRSNEKLAPLHIAIKKGNANLVNLLLANGADPNVATASECGAFSPLHLAILEGDLCAMDALLKVSDQIRYTATIRGDFPLHLAVWSGDIEKCKRVLNRMTEMIHPFSDSQLQFHRGFSPYKKRVDSEKFASLLNLCDGHKRTAVYLAIERNRKDLVELLLDAGFDTQMDCDGKLLFEFATMHCQPLAQDGESKDYTSQAPKDDAILRMLVERSINMESMTLHRRFPIHLAVHADLFDLALAILDNTPHLINHADRLGYTPLHLACRSKSQCPEKIKCIDRLLQMGLSADGAADPKVLPSPLNFAVQHGATELVLLLLKWGASVNLQSGEGLCTPLHIAASTRNCEVIDLLLAAGGDLEVANKEGRTPLYEAVIWKAKQIVAHLLKRKANPNVSDGRSCQSLLHMLIMDFAITPAVNLEIMDLLVMNKISLGSRDIRGLTPLQLLISYLACWSLRPASAQAPLHLRLSALRLLVEAGAELCPWPHHNEGLYRRTPLQTLAFCGMLPEAYYLANVGWPLQTEASSGWMKLPGSTPDQDIAHAYLQLRHANPFSLLHLCRANVRKHLSQQCTMAEGITTEIFTAIETLPVPGSMKTYLNFQDRDYSDNKESWFQLSHLLPVGALDHIQELVSSSEMLTDVVNSA